MKQHDPEVRRHLLKPLVRRRIAPARSERIVEAFRELEERGLASAVLPELLEQRKLAKVKSSKGSWKDPEAARQLIVFASAMYAARRVSHQEYVFLVAQAAEGVHDGRIGERIYPELERLSASMHAIEAEHKISPKEYWLLKNAPPKFRRLSAQWSLIAQQTLGDTLVELENASATELFKNNRTEFERLRERGRRSFFHKDETIPALADTIKRYEKEAQAAAKAAAYTAAVTLLGAAMEGLLLLRCLRSKAKACRVAASLPPKLRPRDSNAPIRWSFDNLIQTCLHAGWLPIIHTEVMEVRPDRLAHILRQMRNLVHPGKVCVERPWIEAERRDFEDADAIYTTLFATVFKGSLLKKYAAEDEPASPTAPAT